MGSMLLSNVRNVNNMKIIILIGLVKLLMINGKPFLCAGIYTAIGFIFGLLWGNPFLPMFIGALIGFGLASLYFWLLNRTENRTVWWIILIVGLLIGLV
jgi:hypothetical protein